jgi:glycerate kinase
VLRVLLAPTAFKGTFSPSAVAGAFARGWRAERPWDELREAPMADGGDGTAEVLAAALGGQREYHEVPHVMGEPHRAPLLRLPDGGAVIEAALACGLATCDRRTLRPRLANTQAVGRLIRICAQRGYDPIIVALGGSASTDGGLGAAWELGHRPLAAGGEVLEPRPAALAGLHRLEPPPPSTGWRPELIGLYDVAGPLAGPHGAARMFSPQKGAGPADVEFLESYLRRLVRVAGAAGSDARVGTVCGGGLGWGLSELLGGTLRSGPDYIAARTGFLDHVSWADVVLTGEGTLDRQTPLGKAVNFVARQAAAKGRSSLAIVGSSLLNDAAARAIGLDLVVELQSRTLEEAAGDLARRVTSGELAVSHSRPPRRDASSLPA